MRIFLAYLISLPMCSATESLELVRNSSKDWMSNFEVFYFASTMSFLVMLSKFLKRVYLYLFIIILMWVIFYLIMSSSVPWSVCSSSMNIGSLTIFYVSFCFLGLFWTDGASSPTFKNLALVLTMPSKQYLNSWVPKT